MTKQAPHFFPRRELGRTGFVASMLGIGDLADRSLPLETCVATVRRAIDAGLMWSTPRPATRTATGADRGRGRKGVRDDLSSSQDRRPALTPSRRRSKATLRRSNSSTGTFVFTACQT
ncbi:MAG: hypothetical protein H6643_03815 [Caldilineaceae bacterium]|nr:hypothetical protein [Caldilineaceae bacterium]